MEINKLNNEFKHKTFLEAMKQTFKIDKYQQKRRSFTDGLWHTESSNSTSKEETTEEVFNREVVFNEEEAMKTFQHLVNKTPMVYDWHTSDSDDKQLQVRDVDYAAYAEFKNAFVASSLTHRPSILTDYDESAANSENNSDCE